MTSPAVPRNTYTDAPAQHPNLILGSLQLLFWLFFRPTAWQNHLAHIDPALYPNLARSSRLQWRNLALWRLLFQAYLILPILSNLILSLVTWEWGKPVGNITIQAVVGMAVGVAFGLAVGVAFGLVVGVAFGLVVGVAFGLAVGVAFGLAVGVAFGVGFGITSAISENKAEEMVWVMMWAVAFGIVVASMTTNVATEVATEVVASVTTKVATGVVASVTIGVAFITVLSAAEGVASGQAWTVAIGVAVVVGTGLAVLVATRVATGVELIVAAGVSVTVNLWRPVALYPFLAVWNTLLYRLDTQRTCSRPSLLRWNSAFWDEWQRLPLLSLDKHLVLVMDRNPAEGKAAIEYLSTSSQSWAAQAAQIELDVCGLERCDHVQNIRNTHHSLTVGEIEGPASALLRSFLRISEDVDAALNQESTYNQRLVLNTVAERLDGLLRELTRSSDKYAVRFRPIADRWRQTVTNYVHELAKAVELRQEIDSPYIIGVPLTQQQEIFVGRTDISARFEKLLLDRRCPPLLLYGQRRMGKTSLLNNLGRLLPNTIIPMFVDLQGPASSASDPAAFLFNIAKAMRDSAMRQAHWTLPSLTREALTSDPFTCFDGWLNQVEQALESNNALLALDEFEKLDSAIAKGRFDEEDVLGMLRHLIQHRPHFKVLLSGSHTLEEFQRWASYLINVQVVHISYLKEAEARQLIERPVTDFTLRYKHDAVERVLDLTHCHPFLLQLLCAEIIALKNEQDPAVRRLATYDDVEAAIPEALSSGTFFFADIERNQINPPGLALLRFLAAKGPGAIASREALSHQFSDDVLDSTLDLLGRRELIEPVGDGYRFQVELIRCWFAQNRRFRRST